MLPKGVTRRTPSAVSNESSSDTSTTRAFLKNLVQLISVFIVFGQHRILIFLTKDAIAYRQELHLGTHQAVECIFRRIHNRFTPHIERRVHNHRAACERVELRDQLLVLQVSGLMYRLDA